VIEVTESENPRKGLKLENVTDEWIPELARHRIRKPEEGIETEYTLTRKSGKFPSQNQKTRGRD